MPGGCVLGRGIFDVTEKYKSKMLVAGKILSPSVELLFTDTGSFVLDKVVGEAEMSADYSRTHGEIKRSSPLI